MPQPNTRDLVVAGPLQNVSIAYRNAAYVGDRVAPIIDNVPARAQISRYVKGSWFRDEAKLRGPGGEAPIVGYTVDHIDVAPQEYAATAMVTDEDRRAAASQNGPPLQPDQDAVEFASDKIDLSKENRIAATIFAGTWSGDAGGEDAAGLWAPNDNTNTFLLDVHAAINTIRSNTGLRPNVLLLSANTFQKIMQLDAVLGLIKYVERGVLTPSILGSIFGFEEVLIGDAVKNTAKEKKDGTDWTTSDLWEKNATKGSAFVFYRPPRPGLKTPSALYQAREALENGAGRRVTTWRVPARHADFYEVAESTHIVQACADLGKLFVDTILT